MSTLKCIVFLLFSSQFLFAQNLEEGAQIKDPLDKIVVENGNIYYYEQDKGVKDRFQLLRVSVLNGKNYIDTIFRCVMPEGNFSHHPVCWDIIDGKLIQIGLSSDSQKKTFSNLRFYEVNKIVALTRVARDLTINYLASPDQSLSAYIPPFDLYNDRIYYRSDTLGGKLYFDFTCTKDSFLFYIYIDGQKTMEKWVYHPFPSRLGFKERSTGHKPWERQMQIKMNLDGPFRSLTENGKNYILTDSGKLFQLNGSNTLEKENSFVREKKIIIVDKDQKNLGCINRDALEKGKDPINLDKLTKNAQILIKS